MLCYITCPLMMGYEGGDLLMTGTAWPTVRSLPKPVCAGCERWPGWPAAPVNDESAFEVAWPPAFGVCAIQIDGLTFFVCVYQSLLFNTSKPFSRSQNCVSQDVDLMVDCFVSCFRITPHNNDLLKVCLNAASPTMFHFVLVNVLHRIITQVQCSRICIFGFFQI